MKKHVWRGAKRVFPFSGCLCRAFGQLRQNAAAGLNAVANGNGGDAAPRQIHVHAPAKTGKADAFAAHKAAGLRVAIAIMLNHGNGLLTVGAQVQGVAFAVWLHLHAAADGAADGVGAEKMGADADFERVLIGVWIVRDFHQNHAPICGREQGVGIHRNIAHAVAEQMRTRQRGKQQPQRELGAVGGVEIGNQRERGKRGDDAPAFAGNNGMGVEAVHFQAAFICLMGKGILCCLGGGVNGFRLLWGSLKRGKLLGFNLSLVFPFLKYPR